MIQVGAGTRVFAGVRAADFRKGIDGLVSYCREVLGENPFSGSLFVFANGRKTAVKILFYDGQGFWLCQKRFSEGKIRHWPRGETEDAKLRVLAARELQTLLWNGDPFGAGFAPEWRKIA